jgi:hypothetical protein
MKDLKYVIVALQRRGVVFMTVLLLYTLFQQLNMNTSTICSRVVFAMGVTWGYKGGKCPSNNFSTTGCIFGYWVGD